MWFKSLSTMKSALLFTTTFALATSAVMAGMPELTPPPSASDTAPVPESSFALIVGGVLWFMLLRKRA